jgi:hypothetical protein
VAIISRNKQFIFISNGITGTTSIEDQFDQFADLDGLNGGLPGLWANKHMPRAILRSLLPREIWDTSFKFVFVRHPLDWFTSQYTYNLTHPARHPPAVPQAAQQAGARAGRGDGSAPAGGDPSLSAFGQAAVHA